MLATLGVIVGMVWFFWASIFEGTAARTPGLVALGIVTLVNIVGFVWTWRRMGRIPNARDIDKDVEETVVFVTAWRVLTLGVLILIVVGAVAGGATGRSIASLAVGIVGLTFFGLATCLLGGILAVFLRSITSVPPPVRIAREEVQARHLERGLHSP